MAKLGQLSSVVKLEVVQGGRRRDSPGEIISPGSNAQDAESDCEPRSGEGRGTPDPEPPLGLSSRLHGRVALDGRLPEGNGDLDLEPGDPDDPRTCGTVGQDRVRYRRLGELELAFLDAGLSPEEVEMVLRVRLEQAARRHALGRAV